MPPLWLVPVLAFTGIALVNAGARRCSVTSLMLGLVCLFAALVIVFGHLAGRT